MQPQYPTQQPPMPTYPQQPQFPVQPAYPPQGYGQPQYPAPQQYPQQAPTQPMPAVSLTDYWQQPSASGGPSIKWKDNLNNPQIGKVVQGFVARPITDADVRPQTNNAGVVQTYRDGRPKAVMVVPLTVEPSPEFPEGQAGWWVKGQSRDELARAMAEAGAPAGAPEAGAFIRITLVGVRPIPNMSPAFQFRVEYVRPQGASGAPAPQQAAPAPAPAPQAHVPAPQQTAPVMSTASGQPVVHQQPIPPAPAPQPVPQQVAPAPAPAAAPSGFSPEQAELLAKLTGGQPAS